MKRISFKTFFGKREIPSPNPQNAKPTESKGAFSQIVASPDAMAVFKEDGFTEQDVAALAAHVDYLDGIYRDRAADSLFREALIVQFWRACAVDYGEETTATAFLG